MGEGIHTLAFQDENDAKMREKADWERLKELSDARAKQWPNTIEALRTRKEQARKERLAAEEQSRLTIDESEARYQKEARKAAIERANMLLYEQDDRVKNFNSKLLLATVLEERAAQVHLQTELRQRELDRQAEWDKQQEESLRRAKAEERAKLEQRRQRAEDLRNSHLESIEHEKDKRKKQWEEQKKEGARLLKEAQDAHERQLEENRTRREQARDVAEQFLRANTDISAQKDKERQREELEDRRIAEFAKLKEQQIKLRRQKQEDKFKQTLASRQALIDKQAELLSQIKDEHEERLHRQIAEEEIKAEKRDQDEKQKKTRMWQDIQAQRQRQLDLRERRKQNDQAEQKEFQAQWKSHSEALILDDMEDRLNAREKAKRLQLFQQQQAAEKKAQADEERRRELEEGKMLKQAVEQEEEMFSNYINMVMKDYQTARQPRSSTR
eukprot:NODE_208_length_1818_cov_121.541549_g157_i0.p1 GENE.NODE_208_length_1818_cov_121.541549_g157_i0~~NODE_208_length_1818_cov_121.541549_g157_i0.p1  ORF type:complete len:443 (-),score=150.51 NODE_208_length_1818_cov_121.541549_g157_i0:463-1791(-)